MEESPSTLDGHGEIDPSYVSATGEETNYAVDDVGNNTAQETDTGIPGTSTVRTRPRKKRGRHPKDPLGQTVRFQCSRLEDLEASLGEYLANPSHPAEHTTLEFTFPVTAAFLIPAGDPLGGDHPADKLTTFTFSLPEKSAVSVVDALYNIPDPKEQMITQKRIARSLVQAISEIDGFHYSFHNNWLSNADRANRFSFYCLDSVLNMGRAANEGLAKIRAGVKSRKRVYECGGAIWIKFSLTKNNLQLDYKHIPMHPTVEERAPTPRRGSKRRRMWEVFHPEKLPENRRRLAKDKPNPEGKARKRKSIDDTMAPGIRKRRATEPRTQDNNSSTPQSAQDRENSFQPLFDFLGSTDRLEGADGADLESDSFVDCNGGSAKPALGAGAEDVPETGNTVPSGNQDKPRPGTMSGSTTIVDLTRGKETRPKKKYTKRSAKKPPGESRTAPVPPTAKQQGNDPAPTSANSNLIDALKKRLIEAQEKIRQLESQKQQEAQPPQPVQPITIVQYHPQPSQPATIVQQPPLPPPAAQAQYAPTQYPNHPVPGSPGQWQYPPPNQAAYPAYPSYQYPTQDSPQPPRPPAPALPATLPQPYVQANENPPPPAPPATLPQPYHQAKQHLPSAPTVQPNPMPSYAFVQIPAHLLAPNVRPHPVPGQSQSVPGPTPPALHYQYNYAPSPLQAQQSPAPAQSRGPSLPLSSVQSQPQLDVASTHRPIAPYPSTAVQQHGVHARPQSEAQPQT
ncbi:hypothetical protein A1O7_05980 [Cladophialophora yegresii CBS 114405]|uniref:Uncharacterized protein n=1 Tax=Cladophialophora yegresii CBS 114405 TaxID=1182544 RepID=W9VSL7_9EURO|nr:uncharacterized protein A1O7_05980 [Cladophialophora yegresii CBS 114405]EXJ58553.1 hypothetical protein A1O7_05980 [Cladophialophora yegresii CBS 114405]